MSLIDKGTCWLDTEAKMTPVYKDGEVIGWYYCPYIPKIGDEK